MITGKNTSPGLSVSVVNLVIKQNTHSRFTNVNYRRTVINTNHLYEVMTHRLNTIPGAPSNSQVNSRLRCSRPKLRANGVFGYFRPGHANGPNWPSGFINGNIFRVFWQ